MDEDSSYEYSETFDSLVYDSSSIKSVETELENHDSSMHSHSADTKCLSPLSTECLRKRTLSHSDVEITAGLSASWTKLRFSRHFSEFENYSAAALESRSSDSKDESDDALTVCSAASDTDTDTQTYCSVSQESSVTWQNDDSQHLSSPHSANLIRYAHFFINMSFKNQFAIHTGKLIMS